MGGFHSKKRKKTSFEKREIHLRGLTEKIRLLKDEISEREKERWAYEREVTVFALRETEWNQERKKLRGEVKRLRKNLEEKEEKIRMMEDGEDKDDGDENGSSGSGGGGVHQKKRCEVKDWELLGTNFLVEQMREERARRDEAVEKWKHLYLAIKTELDDLIHRTRNGDLMYWRAEEEETIQELRMEVRDKEETIKALKAKLSSTEQDVYRRERDIDILRQSLKIINCKKRPSLMAGKKSCSSKLHLAVKSH